MERAGTIDDDRVLERSSRLLVTMPAPEGVEGDIEVIYRQSAVAQQAGPITICEVCVTTIDPDGTRTTVCKPIKCPKVADTRPPVLKA